MDQSDDYWVDVQEIEEGKGTIEMAKPFEKFTGKKGEYVLQSAIKMQGFKMTWKAQRNNKDWVVVKCVNLLPRDQRHIEKEEKILKLIKHESVLEPDEKLQMQVNKQNWHITITKFCTDGDFNRLISNQVTLCEKIKIYFDVCIALEYLHEKEILHRNIKQENLFISSGKIGKLGDFGFARLMKSAQTRLTTASGPPLYMSPEMYSREEYYKPADVWSMGLILLELLRKKRMNNKKMKPLCTQQEDKIKQQINRIQIDQQIHKEIFESKVFINLLEKMLKIKPKERFTMSQVVKTLKEVMPLLERQDEKEKKKLKTKDLKKTADNFLIIEAPTNVEVVKWGKNIKMNLKVKKVNPLATEDQKIYNEKKAELLIQNPQLKKEDVEGIVSQVEGFLERDKVNYSLKWSKEEDLLVLSTASGYEVQITVQIFDSDLRKYYFPTAYHLANKIIEQNQNFRIINNTLGFKIQFDSEDPERLKEQIPPPPKQPDPPPRPKSPPRPERDPYDSYGAQEGPSSIGDMGGIAGMMGGMGGMAAMMGGMGGGRGGGMGGMAAMMGGMGGGMGPMAGMGMGGEPGDLGGARQFGDLGGFGGARRSGFGGREPGQNPAPRRMQERPPPGLEDMMGGMPGQGRHGASGSFPQQPQAEQRQTIDQLVEQILILEVKEIVECTPLGHKYHALASLYNQTGLFSKAIESCHSAVKYLNMVEPPEYQKIAKIYHTMGQSYMRMQKVEMALECYNQALIIRENNNLNSYQQLILSNSIGEAHLANKNFEEAEKTFYTLLEIIKSSNSENMIHLFIQVMVNIGNLLAQKGHPQQAAKHFSEAFKLLKNLRASPSTLLSVRLGIISCLVAIGMTSQALKEIDAGFKEMKEGGKHQEPEFFTLKQTTIEIITKLLSSDCKKEILQQIKTIITVHLDEQVQLKSYVDSKIKQL